MSTIRIATHFNIELEFEVAPFHRRLFAWALDLVIQVFYLIIATRFINALAQRVDYDEDAAYNLWAVSLLLMLPFFLYHVVCEITLNGQSIGKKIMDIRVVNEKGGKASISQYIIRWLIKTSDYTALLIILYAPYAMSNGIMVYWAIIGSLALLITDIFLTVGSKKSQRLGDILAHTILIRGTQKETIDNTVFLPVDDTYQPVFPQVMQLSDRDINSLKGILEAVKKYHNPLLAERASDRIKSHLGIESSLAPFDFLEVLLKDYNYLVSR